MYWIRQLFTRPKAHIWAAFEVIVTFALAISPFFVTFLVSSAKQSNDQFIDFSSMVDRGQLYLLAYGLFGPILWLAFVKPDVPRHNARVIIGVFAVFAIIPVVGFLGVDPTFSSIQNKRIVEWSYWFYGIFLLVNYLLVFYCNIEPPPADVSLERGSSSMKERYEQEFEK